jgi:hypothetical protein
MFCASNNGLAIRAVTNDYVAQTGEVLFNVMDMSEITDEQLTAAFPGRAVAIKAQKITELNAEYQTKYDVLAKQYAKIYLSDGDTVNTKQTAAATYYKAIMANYTIEKAAIING